MILTSATAHAAPLDPVAPAGPTAPAAPSTPAGGGVSVQINGADGSPSTAVVTLLGITLLSVAPALLLMMTSFTKIFVVLAMTRNALALPNIPPNQVLAGLALFLSFFIMGPVLTDINTSGRPALSERAPGLRRRARTPAPSRSRRSCWPHTRQEDIALMTRAAGMANPANAGRGAADHADSGLHDFGAARRVHHRLRHLHPVPDHRHRGRPRR